jgi:hypothetical protein
MLADHTKQFAGLGQDEIGTALIFYFTKSKMCVASMQKFHFLPHH